MAQLHQDYQKFVEKGAEIITIGPEDKDSFAKWWHEHEMPFTGIPDPTHTIAIIYGQQSKLLKGGRMPAMTLIDKEGKTRYLHYGDSMSDIPEDDVVLAMIDELNKEGTGENTK
jgi:peroxiredoxin Q/BCP